MPPSTRSIPASLRRKAPFEAAESHLPRLKDLGVDILWLMPIHEIG